jgi:AcrR family transcriptional regulator
VEDIAKAAVVSVPTAYNHFPGGKQELIGAVYAPLQYRSPRRSRPTLQPTDPGDVRILVPATTPLIRLISDGQQRGVFRADPPAREAGAYHGNGLLLRALTRPSESPGDTAALVLSQLLPALGLS